ICGFHATNLTLFSKFMHRVFGLSPFMAFRGVMGTMEILRVMGFLGMVGNAKIAMGRGRLMLF
ncbi:MAG: hypothetical protein K1W14_14825, partial [Muribaculaceae bacterium]